MSSLQWQTSKNWCLITSSSCIAFLLGSSADFIRVVARAFISYRIFGADVSRIHSETLWVSYLWRRWPMLPKTHSGQKWTLPILKFCTPEPVRTPLLTFHQNIHRVLLSRQVLQMWYSSTCAGLWLLWPNKQLGRFQRQRLFLQSYGEMKLWSLV